MNDNKTYLTNSQVIELAKNLNRRIFSERIGIEKKRADGITIAPVIKIYGVPRGGIPVTYLLAAQDAHHITIVDSPELADVIVDDIIDSGATLEQYAENYNKPFYALINKITEPDDKWYVFPWEAKTNGTEEGVEANVTRIIQYIGDNPTREGLLETPKRFTKALGEWFSGYNYNDADITKLLKVFEDGADGCDEMVIRRNIPIYSHCEHHVAPIFGTCTIAYIPRNKVLGLSKMDRLVEIYARRLQVQERLTNQIADAMWETLEPIGVGVYINARHMCVESRGIKNQHSETITTALRGAMKTEASTRAEFLLACKK